MRTSTEQPCASFDAEESLRQAMCCASCGTYHYHPHVDELQRDHAHHQVKKFLARGWTIEVYPWFYVEAIAIPELRADLQRWEDEGGTFYETI